MDMKKVVAVAGSAVAASAISSPYGSILVPIAAIAKSLATSQDDIKGAELKGVETLTNEARKQSIVMDFQAHQARVAQEMSIAERIASSTEVEIEEFYDTSGAGSAGVAVGKDNVSLGASGEGRKITKRVIRFKGGELRANVVAQEQA